MWIRTSLALDPIDKGFPSVEIDEISAIGNINNIIWAFVIIGRSNKQAFFFAMNDCWKETLLPIIKNNVYMINTNIDSLELTTRVFSDCFAYYREVDFNNIHYILHRVNHLVWFGVVSFYKNNVEGL